MQDDCVDPNSAIQTKLLRGSPIKREASLFSLVQPTERYPNQSTDIRDPYSRTETPVLGVILTLPAFPLLIVCGSSPKDPSKA